MQSESSADSDKTIIHLYPAGVSWHCCASAGEPCRGRSRWGSLQNFLGPPLLVPEYASVNSFHRCGGVPGRRGNVLGSSAQRSCGLASQPWFSPAKLREAHEEQLQSTGTVRSIRKALESHGRESFVCCHRTGAILGWAHVLAAFLTKQYPT